MKQDTNINIKLPKNLKEDVKKWLGENVSEELRTALENLISKKKNSVSPYHYCFVCDNTKESFDDMNLVPIGEYDDENNLTAIICDECLDNIIRTSKEKIAYEVKKKDSSKRTDNESYKLIRRFVVKCALCWNKESNSFDEQSVETISTIKKCKRFSKDLLWLEQHLVESYPTLIRIEPGRIIMKNNFDNIVDKSKELLEIYDDMTK